jgi:GAF domain-containing protein/ribosomal protein L37E
VDDQKDKPVFDEQTLARLLEAAYVLQEHNRELLKLGVNLERQREHLGAQDRSEFTPSTSVPQTQRPDSVPHDDYTFTLAQIVETQRQIQARHLELEDAMLLAAARLIEITKASGAAIGLLDGKKIRYRAVAGLMALPVGSEVQMEKSLCVACLRTGQVVRCVDVNAEFLLDIEDCQRRGIRSMIAVPVYHDGGTAGGLELYYARTQAFTEHDVHSCQLMAGLITEALARDQELSLKKSLASERAVMLEALEKLKPNLAALADAPQARGAVAAAGAVSSASTTNCRKCGQQIMGEEQFCGSCGTPRSGDYEAASMQSKVASLWEMQEASKGNEASAPVHNHSASEDAETISDQTLPEKHLADSIEEAMPELFAPAELHVEEVIASSEGPDNDLETFLSTPTLTVPAEASGDLEEQPEHDNATAVTALAKPEHAWSSAASARAFLEQLGGANRPGAVTRFWNARRGDIYLAIAVILVAAVILWGISSNHSVGATGNPNSATSAHHKPAPDADLSWFDRTLISLGLAEAPPTPESKGNPDTQVWVDLHTALYYCPGTDLYGKTPKGKFTSQKDAQLDQFEPAYRKPCE